MSFTNLSKSYIQKMFVTHTRVIALLGVFLVLKTKSFTFVSASPDLASQQNGTSDTNEHGGDGRVFNVPNANQTGTILENGPIQTPINDTQGHGNHVGTEGILENRPTNDEVAQGMQALQIASSSEDSNSGLDDDSLLPSEMYSDLYGVDGSWEWARQLELENKLNSYCTLFHLHMQYGALYVNDACIFTAPLELGDSDSSEIISADVVRYSRSPSNFVYLTKGTRLGSVFVVRHLSDDEDLYTLGELIHHVPLPTPQNNI